MDDHVTGVRGVGSIFRLKSGMLLALDYVQDDVIGGVFLRSSHAVGSAAANGTPSRTAWHRKLSFEKFLAFEDAQFVCFTGGLHHMQNLDLLSDICYAAVREEVGRRHLDT